MHLDSTIEVDSLKFSPKSSKKIIEVNHLKTSRLLHVLAIIVFPLLGLAIALISFEGKAITLLNLGLLLGMFVLTTIGIEVGYHRYFSHRAFKTNRAVSVTLAILGSMAGQGPFIYWVGLHRRHHEYSDQPNDPHSPNLHGEGTIGRLQGLWHSHIGWMFDHEIPNPIYYAPELIKDEVLSRVNKLYLIWLLLGLVIPAILGSILRGSWTGAWEGFLWGGLVRLLLGENAIWTINSIVHVYGRRSFNTKDRSRNNIWLSIPTLGGSWHNNHHAFPNSAITGLEWWQIDLSGWLIRTLEFAGLVWEVKKPSIGMIAAKRNTQPNL